MEIFFSRRSWTSFFSLSSRAFRLRNSEYENTVLHFSHGLVNFDTFLLITTYFNSLFIKMLTHCLVSYCPCVSSIVSSVLTCFAKHLVKKFSLLFFSILTVYASLKLIQCLFKSILKIASFRILLWKNSWSERIKKV